jgi:IS605 OrfB family transposase
MNLFPQTSRFVRKVEVEGLANFKTGEVVRFSSKTGMLFPLEFGFAFHELDFLRTGEPESARLVHRMSPEGSPVYELHVTFSFWAEKVVPSTWLGVDRGVYKLAAFCVTDDLGAIVEEAVFDGRSLRHVQRQVERRLAAQQRRGRVVRDRSRVAEADRAVHMTANAIVSLAKKHHAQVVLEDLTNFDAIRRTGRPKGQRRSSFNRLLGRVQYGKLVSVLDYKLAMEGLPKPVYVRAAGTSQTCPECGHWSKANRPKAPAAGGDGFNTERFECEACGHRADADLNAARVIGMKGCWWETKCRGKVQKGKKLADSLQFDNHIKECARIRTGLGGADAPVPVRA